jgi:ferrous iron transport protein A
MIVGVNSIKSIFSNNFTRRSSRDKNVDENLTRARVNRKYVVKHINTDDDGMKDFLFTLGCYEGESITVISVLSDNYIVSIKDGRYSIDKELAEAIRV